MNATNLKQAKQAVDNKEFQFKETGFVNETVYGTLLHNVVPIKKKNGEKKYLPHNVSVLESELTEPIKIINNAYNPNFTQEHPQFNKYADQKCRKNGGRQVIELMTTVDKSSEFGAYIKALDDVLEEQFIAQNVDTDERNPPNPHFDDLDEKKLRDVRGLLKKKYTAKAKNPENKNKAIDDPLIKLSAQAGHWPAKNGGTERPRMSIYDFRTEKVIKDKNGRHRKTYDEFRTEDDKPYDFNNLHEIINMGTTIHKMRFSIQFTISDTGGVSFTIPVTGLWITPSDGPDDDFDAEYVDEAELETAEDEEENEEEEEVEDI